MKNLVRSFGGPLLMLLILGAAIAMLHRELKHYDLRDFLDSLRAIPPRAVLIAAGLTVTSYIVLTGYELLGVWYLKRDLGLRRVALASLLGYALAYNLGPLLGGAAIRYRLYTTWGLSTIEITKHLLLLAVTFWCGVGLLGGVIFTALMLPIPSGLHLPVTTSRPLGIALALGALAYIALCGLHRRPLRLGQWEFAPPPLRIALLQFVVAAVDLSLASSVLYTLLPPGLEIPYFQFVAFYLLAIIAALVTQVPGGLGVLEVVILLLLAPDEPQRLIGSLLAFRAIYFLLPLGLALVVLTANELALHREHAGRLVVQLGQWTDYVSPPALAVVVFLAGAILMFAGGMPADPRRFPWHAPPQPLRELAHVASSVIGMMLMVTAYDLQRRVRAAYGLAVGLLAAGLVAALLRGPGYEEAITMAVSLAFLLPSQNHFFRRGQFGTERFSPRWLVAILFVLACTGWLIVLSYDAGADGPGRWWGIGADPGAARSVRGLAAAVLALAAMAAVQYRRARPAHLPTQPTPSDVQWARDLVARFPRASAHLALVGDKCLLFNRDHSAFIMYGVHRRSAVAMGDPVGPAEAARDLAWTFREICDQRDQRPIFYQVREDGVRMYVEMGLTLIKLGEEARVHLPRFGAGRTEGLIEQLREEGRGECRLRVVQPPLGDRLLELLRRVSDAWRAGHPGPENRFSVGYFQADYLRGCPVVLAEHHGEVVGFGNLWPGAGREELSIDLIRFVPSAPEAILDFLFLHALLWGRDQGFQWFSLGMAPLAAMEDQPLDPIWRKAATIAFRHGEHFASPSELRRYKEKFEPEWSATLLAAPETLALPLLIADIAALVSPGAPRTGRKG